MSAKNKPGPGQEIVIARKFNAPRELVFAAWTESKHLAQWWGPQGFTNPVAEWDAKVDGKIYDVMRGPDGTDYPMGGRYLEIQPPSKLVMTTGAMDAQGVMMFEFHHVITFEEAKGGKTVLTIRSRIINSSEGSEMYTHGYRAGMTSSLEKLAELVEGMAPRLIISSRLFSATPEQVYGAFSDPQRLTQWWGPNGFTSAFQEFDLRPGGRWRLTLYGPEGKDYPNEKIFSAVVPPARIAFRHYQATHNFVMTMTFEPEGTGTKVTWLLLFDIAAECAQIRSMIETANEQNFDRLATHLAG